MRAYFGKVIRLVRELPGLYTVAGAKTFLRYVWAIISSTPSIIKKGNLGPAFAKMEGREYSLHPLWVPMILDGKNFGRVTELYARGVYFFPPDVMLKKGMTVVDLGANLGIFTLLAALVGKRVVAVEAIQEFIDTMRENLKRNECLNKVTIVRGMVGYNSGLFTNKKILHDTSGDIVPPNLSLNNIFKENGLSVVDFMKIDIEGSEFDLFSHDIGWLSNVARIAMEVHPQYGNISQLVSNIEKAGFKAWLVSLNRKVVSEIRDEAGYLFAKNLKF